jgi:hypothetical protein
VKNRVQKPDCFRNRVRVIPEMNYRVSGSQTASPIRTSLTMQIDICARPRLSVERSVRASHLLPAQLTVGARLTVRGAGCRTMAQASRRTVGASPERTCPVDPVQKGRGECSGTGCPL